MKEIIVSISNKNINNNLFNFHVSSRHFEMLEKNNIHKYHYYTIFSIVRNYAQKLDKNPNPNHVRENIPREREINRKKDRLIDIAKRGEGYTHFFASIFKVYRNFAWFLTPRGNHIDCRQRTPLRALHDLASIYPISSPSRLPALAFFSNPQSPTPYGGAVTVVTPLRLYKFYIIFMRHKVVEKPTKEGEEG